MNQTSCGHLIFVLVCDLVLRAPPRSGGRWCFARRGRGGYSPSLRVRASRTLREALSMKLSI